MLVQEERVQYEIDYASFKERLSKGAIPPDARVTSPILTDGEWRAVGELRLYERIRRLGLGETPLWLTHTTEEADSLADRQTAPVARLAWFLVAWNFLLSIVTAFVAFGGNESVGVWAPWMTVIWAAVGAAVAVILDQYRLGANWAKAWLTILAVVSLVIGGAALWLGAMSDAWLSSPALALAFLALTDILLGVRMLYRMLRSDSESIAVQESAE